MKREMQMGDAGINPSGCYWPVGTTLSANVSAACHFTRTFPWTIDKSVTPAFFNLFPGDFGTAVYTVTVTKGGGVDEAFVNGQVCVTNGGAVATQNLAIIVNLTMPPSSTIIASTIVDLSQKPILSQGEAYCYNYRIDIPGGSVILGRTYKATSHVTITNHSGHMGIPFGPSPSDTDTLATSPTLINDSVHVEDTNGVSFTANTSGCQTYEMDFTCDNTGINPNTATILETAQESSASVAVMCECPETVVNETVCVQADITVTPHVTVGTVESFCVGEAVIGACPGPLAEVCAFLVSRNICVQIPLAFSARVSAEPSGIVCGTPIPGGCTE